MLPDNFDPLFAALGIRKRDWSKPAPLKTVTATPARTREATTPLTYR